MKKGLIRKGAKHPTHPSYKFTGDAYTKKAEAYKKADELELHKGKDIKIIKVPQQRLLYAKNVRITPKRSRISK